MREMRRKRPFRETQRNWRALPKPPFVARETSSARDPQLTPLMAHVEAASELKPDTRTGMVPSSSIHIRCRAAAERLRALFLGGADAVELGVPPGDAGARRDYQRAVKSEPRFHDAIEMQQGLGHEAQVIRVPGKHCLERLGQGIAD